MSDASSTIQAQARPRRPPRARPLPPNVTARNLAIEKKRRNVFNDLLLDLASLLPTLTSARRLSKVLIVRESIRQLRQQHTLCRTAAQDLQNLLVENSRLIFELNAMRTQVGGPEAALYVPKPISVTPDQLSEFNQEILGENPAGVREYNTSHEFHDNLLGTNHWIPPKDRLSQMADDISPAFEQSEYLRELAQETLNYPYDELPDPLSGFERPTCDQWHPHLLSSYPYQLPPSQLFAPTIDEPSQSCLPINVTSSSIQPLEVTPIDPTVRPWIHDFEPIDLGMGMQHEGSNSRRVI